MCTALLKEGGSQYQLAMSLNALGTCHAHVRRFPLTHCSLTVRLQVGHDEDAITNYTKAIAAYRVVRAQTEGGQDDGLGMALNNQAMMLAKWYANHGSNGVFLSLVAQQEICGGETDV